MTNGPVDPSSEPSSSQDHDRGRESRQLWLGFWPWLITTGLLLALIAALAGYLHTREPEIVEVIGPTPPPVAPAAEIVAEASDLRQQIALKQNQLKEKIDALDPPVCEPPKAIDPELLALVRGREAENLRSWRGLLTPLPATLPATPQTPAPTDRQSVAPTNESKPGTDTLQRRSSAPTGAEQQPSPAQVNAAGRIDPLTTNALRNRLERSSAIVVGLPPDGQPGLSTGTGFFISNKTLVTNYHVIEKADPDRLFITSDAFDTALVAKLVATSRTSNTGSVDLAVLELTSGEAAAFAPIALQVDKLNEVVAAGYPGLGLVTDVGFQKLLGGDLSEAPDLNMNKGEVRSIKSLGEITQIVHTADVLKGYSGGPLMDMCGRVVGVNTFVQVDKNQAAKLNNAISTGDLSRFLNAKGVPVIVDNRVCMTK